MGIICEEDIFLESGEESMEMANCSCSSTKINCPFLQLEIFGSNANNTPRSLQEASRAELRCNPDTTLECMRSLLVTVMPQMLSLTNFHIDGCPLPYDDEELALGNPSELLQLTITSSTGILRSALFQNLTNLKVLEMTGGNFTFENSTKWSSYRKPFFRHLVNLQKISLAENNLAKLPDWLFVDCRRLSHIDLSYNRLIRWPNNEAEVWFENMRFINLSHNKFRYVPSQFWTFLQLEELDMSHNLLGSSYEMGTFNLIYFGLKLKRVDFSYNRMKTFLVPKPPSQRKTKFLLDLSGNPFVCDCWVSELWQAVRAGNGPLGGMFDVVDNDVSCQNETGELLSQLQGSDLLCPFPNNSTYTSLPSTIISTFCPEQCTCLLNRLERVTLVDCSFASLSTFPSHLPFISQHSDHVHLDMTSNQLESLESLAATSLTLDVDEYAPVPVFRQTKNKMLEMTISGFEEEEESKPHSLDVITELILTSNQISRFASEHLPTRLKLFALDNNRLEDFSEKEINILLNLTKSPDNATEVENGAQLRMGRNPYGCNSFCRLLPLVPHIVDAAEVSSSCRGESTTLINKTVTEAVCAQASSLGLRQRLTPPLRRARTEGGGA